jgi:alpha-amylase
MTERLTSLFLLFILLSSCAQAQPTASTPQLTESPAVPASPASWWEEAVFYEIFVRSFYDTDGNGIGDFNGITQKLDYLSNLGVTAIWLMPIHPSPSYHGYDVIDYYEVNPDYGTIEDFRQLVREAHQRDIRIIIDLVLNHTSSEHPHFIEANNDPQSPYRDWYIWSETPQGNYWHEGKHGYYFGFFQDGMPDLNYRNPDVTTEMENVVKFWLNEVGIDGFRLDAAKHLIEEDGKVENTQSTHAWYRDFYEYYKSINPDAYTVGEVFGAGAFIANTYENQFDHVFNFELAGGFVASARTGTNTPLSSAIAFALNDEPDFNFATFLTNHDQERVMSVLDGDTDKAKIAAFLLLTAPGTPFIYYGEEIGMQGRKPDEDIRLPMQWSADINGGFTTGTPWRAVDSSASKVNAVAQENSPDSLLNHYRTLMKLRAAHSALQTGKLFLIETNNSGLYAILRADGKENLLVLANLGDKTISDYALTLSDAVLTDNTYEAETLFGSEKAQPIQVTGGAFQHYKPVPELSPYSMLIIQFHP